MSMSCAFIGLGVMGGPMARHLQQRGFATTVYNRTAAKATQWANDYAGRAAPSPREAAVGADVVLICVGNDDDVRSVVFGADGVLAGMHAGSVLVDHTTASAELARELAIAAAERGIAFLDAPVSGGQAGAENGILTAMIGGDLNALKQVDVVLGCYCKTREHMGPAGYGQLAKMVNQVCIAGVVQGLAEGLQLARKVGLDADALIRCISQGAAGSWQMQNRYRSMWDQHYNHGFAVEWMRKDLKIVLDEAQRQGVSMPLTALVDQFYAEVENMGGSRWDTSSLLARLEGK